MTIEQSEARARAVEIIDRHREYMGVGQVMMKVENAIAAVMEALASEVASKPSATEAQFSTNAALEGRPASDLTQAGDWVMVPRDDIKRLERARLEMIEQGVNGWPNAALVITERLAASPTPPVSPVE